MINTQYINLNMIPSGVMPVLYCSQYDIGRPLGVVVYNGAESVDLSGYTCTIEATRTDKTPMTAGVTTSGNIGVFETTATMTNQADTYKGKLVLTDENGKRVASLAFVLVVTVRTMDEDAEEIEEDASIYQQYTGTVQTIIASIRADLAAEITARQNAISTEASTRAAAVSAEAAARQSADNTLQSNINAEASTRATQDASLQSQIDQLIAPSGEAPSAAEVENARIGSDGTVYPTLGDAIRTQNSLLKSHLDEIEDDFYRTSSEAVIDTDDERSYETAPENTVAIAHTYAFKAGRKYRLEVTVNSATFLNNTNALRADTSRNTNTSTAALNTALIRTNYYPIEDGTVFVKEFEALSTDVNLLMRYMFGAGTQDISVKVYEYTGTNEEVTELKTRVTNCETDIDEINDAIRNTSVCIDETDSGSYESEPSTVSKAHPFAFVAGKKYKATLKVTSGAFKANSDAIRVQQSGSTGTSTTSLLGYVFRIDQWDIVVGKTYESVFTAAEGCVNLLARYKFAAGEQEIDLDVTLTEYVSVEVDKLKEDVQKKYADCTRKSRMLMGAHRGAEYFAPPNCVAAYEIAGKMGFPWAWLAQIRYSAENTLYVMHDEDVSITTNGTGNMSNLTDEYINGLLCNKISSYDYSKFSDADLRVPTLEQAIQICLRYGMKMCFRIEPLPNSMESERQIAIWTNFQTLIKAYGIADDWACYSGYNANEMRLCRTLLGDDVELCPYIGTVTAQEVIDWFTASNIGGNRSVLLPATSLTLEGIKLLHTNGIKVYAFTNSTSPTQAQMEQLATWGADILQNPKYARIPIV